MKNMHYRTSSVNVLSLTSTQDDEKRLKFCIISQNNDCERWDWDIGKYTERLNLQGAKFDELKTMFKDHILSIDNAIARVENTRIENNELICECVFGDDAKSAEIYEKYRSGILSDVSIGYKILFKTRSKQNGENFILVDKFEIYELSAVWKGADKGAKIRNSQDYNAEQIAKNFIENQKMQLNLKEKTL